MVAALHRMRTLIERGAAVAFMTASIATVLPACARADAKADLIKKGEYIAVASDCAPCHMAVGGHPMRVDWF